MNRIMITTGILAILAVASIKDVSSIEPPSFQCLTPDSAEAMLNGLPPTHEFGTDTTSYPSEFDYRSEYPAFGSVFRLYLTDGVSQSWTSEGFRSFMEYVLDDTTDTSDDLFCVVWDYFCHADSNEYITGVRYPANDVATAFYDTIRVSLYSIADIDSPCTYHEYFCDGYSTAAPGGMVLRADFSPWELAHLGFAHELQHVAYQANNSYGYNDVDESLSTLAEYMVGYWHPPYDHSYDSSIHREQTCELDSKYQVEKIWMAYLYETFKGAPADTTDDLIYDWLRTTRNGGYELSMGTLADALEGSEYAWLGGTTGAERLDNLFQNYAVAKFANAPEFESSGAYGSHQFHTLTDAHFFEDNFLASLARAVPCRWSQSTVRPGTVAAISVRDAGTYESSRLTTNSDRTTKM